MSCHLGAALFISPVTFRSLGLLWLSSLPLWYFSVNACLILFLFFPELQVALKKHTWTSPARWKIKAPDCYHYYYTTRHFINTKVWHFPPKKGLLLPFCMATLLNPNSISEDPHLFKRCCISKSNLTFHLLWMDPFFNKNPIGPFFSSSPCDLSDITWCSFWRRNAETAASPPAANAAGRWKRQPGKIPFQHFSHKLLVRIPQTENVSCIEMKGKSSGRREQPGDLPLCKTHRLVCQPASSQNIDDSDTT